MTEICQLAPLLRDQSRAHRGLTEGGSVVDESQYNGEKGLLNIHEGVSCDPHNYVKIRVRLWSDNIPDSILYTLPNLSPFNLEFQVKYQT